MVSSIVDYFKRRRIEKHGKRTAVFLEEYARELEAAGFVACAEEARSLARCCQAKFDPQSAADVVRRVNVFLWKYWGFKGGGLC